MMTLRCGAWIAGLLVIGLAGCQKPAAANVHETMKSVINPQALALWDVSNRGLNDAGEPDASRLSDADWTKLAASAEAMKGAASKLADAKTYIAAAPGEKLQDEGGAGGGAGAAKVQGHIDANKADFAAKAKALADTADKILTAAKAHDAKTIADQAGNLDQVCEACHKVYWYPELAAAQ